MNIRYVANDLDWTELMKGWVHNHLVLPVQRELASEHFELSVSYGRERHPTKGNHAGLEMWAVLQTSDGFKNEVVRCRGGSFFDLAVEVSQQLCAQVREAREHRRFNLNPFNFLLAERSA